MTWAAGLFTDGVGDDFGDATHDFGRVVLRVTGLPIDTGDPEDRDAQRLLHLGLSAHILYASGDSVRYRSRPESHLAPYVIDTGEVAAEGALVACAEAAWVNGPFCLQGEFLHSWVKGHSEQDLSFHGFYASMSWFLTGESRPYNRAKGTFSRVLPHHHLSPSRGTWGAWEIAGRFSHTDLNSEYVTGGRVALISAGLNWYLHSHLKWRFDYGTGRVTGRSEEGTFHFFQTRLETDF
jgi:phosphate-selective porin OprO/OprP